MSKTPTKEGYAQMRISSGMQAIEFLPPLVGKAALRRDIGAAIRERRRARLGGQDDLTAIDEMLRLQISSMWRTLRTG